MRNAHWIGLSCVILLMMSSVASAHPEASSHAHAGSVEQMRAGVLHPIFGIDHLAAMVAVGLWAVQLGGRAKWLVPFVFVLAMALGGWLLGNVAGRMGLQPPALEQVIVSSVFVLGLLIAMAIRLPAAAACGLVGLFAVYHGYAHLAERPGGGSALPYATGFALATAFLHLAGMGLGTMLKKSAGEIAVRLAGGAVALVSVVLMAKMI